MHIVFSHFFLEYVSLETRDDGARRLLTLKTSWRRLGGQPAVGA